MVNKKDQDKSAKNLSLEKSLKAEIERILISPPEQILPKFIQKRFKELKIEYMMDVIHLTIIDIADDILRSHDIHPGYKKMLTLSPEEIKVISFAIDGDPYEAIWPELLNTKYVLEETERALKKTSNRAPYPGFIYGLVGWLIKALDPFYPISEAVREREEGWRRALNQDIEEGKPRQSDIPFRNQLSRWPFTHTHKEGPC